MNPSQATFDRIVEAHHAVRRFARRVAAASDTAALGRLLEELARLLPEHFEFEERGFRRMELRKRIDPVAAEARVHEEHRDLLGELRDLLATRPTGPAPDWVDDVRAFARALEDHERFEASLVKRR